MRPDDHFGAAPAFAQECPTCGYLLDECECEVDWTPPHGIQRDRALWCSRARHPSIRGLRSPS
jgi:hypothetical protein